MAEQMTEEKFKALDKKLSSLQTELEELACTNLKHADGTYAREGDSGMPCTRQFEGERDRQGRPVFWYGTACKIVEKFCPTCAAYWHIAVARNEVFTLLRRSREDLAAAEELRRSVNR